MNEQELCKKKLIDLSRQANRKGIVLFSDFLNLNELNIYHQNEKFFETKTEASGGVPFAERQIVAFIPDALYYEWQFPIAYLEIVPSYPKFAEKLGHRDILGSMMNLLQIPFIVHTILGLPGETNIQLLQTMDYLNRIQPFGIKLQLLHVLKGTDLADDYLAGKFEALTFDAYIDLVISCLAHLSPDIVIHRVTGDGPKNLLITPTWSMDKRGVLNELHHRMKKQGIRQGDLFPKDNYS